MLLELHVNRLLEKSKKLNLQFKKIGIETQNSKIRVARVYDMAYIQAES